MHFLELDTLLSKALNSPSDWKNTRCHQCGISSTSECKFEAETKWQEFEEYSKKLFLCPVCSWLFNHRQEKLERLGMKITKIKETASL